MGQQLPQPPPKPYDVLVTGSSGHLGTALMIQLPRLGFNPLGIDILPATVCSTVTATTTKNGSTNGDSHSNTLVGSISDRAFMTETMTANPHIQHIIHAATLHKPHVGSHTTQHFIDTNITGTSTLLEAVATCLPSYQTTFQSFIFISTTSTFGAALSPSPDLPAAWIDESVTPVPKNIYGVTKCAAEDMCYLAYKNLKIPALVLRTSRFFPEEDDDEERRSAMAEDNLKVLELTYRRCDIADVVSACHVAMKKAKEVGWGKYIISAPPPFVKNGETLRALNDGRFADVLANVAPDVEAVFRARGWKILPRIDRVYDSSKALKELGWAPEYTFERTVERVRKGEEWRSPLALQVGRKGYHAVSTGVYTKR